MEKILVVSEPVFAKDGSFVALVQSLKETGATVEMLMVDRMGADINDFSAKRFTRVVLLLQTESIDHQLVSTIGQITDKVNLYPSRQEVSAFSTRFVLAKSEPSFDTYTIIENKPQTVSLPKRKPAAARAAELWKVTPSPSVLLDGDELITAEDMQKRQPIECGVSKTRKPCKNCTCGLADMVADIGEDDLAIGKTSSKQPMTSSCGNCGLGDAFRCTGCPYLGMPAFEPGQKVMLPTRTDV